MQINSENQSTICTTTGTMFTLFVSIGFQDFLKTVILGCIGAIVSFLMSLFLKWLSKKIKK